MQDAIKELSCMSLKTLYFKLFERSSFDVDCCLTLSQMSTLRYSSEGGTRGGVSNLLYNLQVFGY